MKPASAPASQAQLNQLRDPGALQAIEVLQRTGWLAPDTPSLEKFFEADPTHPARLALNESARNGGSLAVIQFAIFLSFTALAVIISAFHTTLPITLFVLWGVLGIGGGLLALKYPGRIFRKRNTGA